MIELMSILKLAADAPALLRAADVDRVMQKANDAGVLSEFREWLLAFELRATTRAAVTDWRPS